MPSLGLELKNIGKKMDQKRAKTAVYQKNIKKKENRKKVVNNFFVVFCIARTRWIWNAGALAIFKVK